MADTKKDTLTVSNPASEKEADTVKDTPAAETATVKKTAAKKPAAKKTAARKKETTASAKTTKKTEKAAAKSTKKNAESDDAKKAEKSAAAKPADQSAVPAAAETGTAAAEEAKPVKKTAAKTAKKTAKTAVKTAPKKTAAKKAAAKPAAKKAEEKVEETPVKVTETISETIPAVIAEEKGKETVVEEVPVAETEKVQEIVPVKEETPKAPAKKEVKPAKETNAPVKAAEEKKEPVSEAPAAPKKEAVVKKPAAVVEETAVEEPAAAVEETIVEEPVAAVEETAVEEPAAAAEETVVEEPVAAVVEEIAEEEPVETESPEKLAEKLAHYKSFDLNTDFMMADAMGIHTTYDDIARMLMLSDDNEQIAVDLITKAGVKPGDFVFDEDGFDLSLIPVLIERVADSMDFKAADYRDLIRSIEANKDFELTSDAMLNAEEYHILFDLVKKILMLAQQKGITSVAELEKVLPADLKGLVVKFMDVAYALLRNWQYNDVKYYEGFINAVLSQFGDLHTDLGNRALMDVADLYIIHGDFGLGDANYGYVLRENKLKDYIYLRFANIYKDIDRNKAKAIAGGALRYVDGRYTYYPDIIKILES